MKYSKFSMCSICVGFWCLCA